MSGETLLDRVSLRAGIEPFYWDIRGVQHFAEPRTKCALLAALGLLPRAADHAEGHLAEEQLAGLEAELFETDAAEVVPPVIVVRKPPGDAPGGSASWTLRLRVPEQYRHGALEWRIGADTVATAGVVELAPLSEQGRMASGGAPVVELSVLLPLPDEPGYYELSLGCRSGTDTLLASSELVVAPPRCFAPANPGRALGISLQLSSLVSDVQLGIGDFGDLLDAVPLLRELSVDAIGLNPLHGLFEGNSQEVSPYSPSSRLNRNILMLCVRDLPEWCEDDETRAHVASEDFQRDLADAARAPIIPFAEVYRLKGSVLERLGAWFRERHLKAGTPWAGEFAEWVRAAPEGVLTSARFSALRQSLLRQSDAYWGWPAWPAELRDPQSPAVARFCEEHHELIDYHLWLQWSLDRQLGALQELCLRSGMRYGLYLDLALGAGYGGAETWAHQAVYAFDAGAGAPPDELGPQGQSWGLPPYKPAVLRQLGYRPFRDAIRAAMRHAGVLRLDHIMSLCRLFWIPAGLKPSCGAYIRYPVHDLMGIVALESVRNRCMVIGEDLGTVPDEVRAAMHDFGVLSYKVLYFMNEGDSAVPPNRYPEESLVVTSTHDLPTLWSFWEGRDIDLREQLRLFDTPEITNRVRVLRDGARRMFCKGLAAEGLWDASQPIPSAMNWDLFSAIHRFLARACSRLQMVQIEDLLALVTQVNVPGTTTEHPNWRYRLPCSLDEIFAEPRVVDLLRAVRHERQRQT